jgi:hypothetical protein
MKDMRVVLGHKAASRFDNRIFDEEGRKQKAV